MVGVFQQWPSMEQVLHIQWQVDVLHAPPELHATNLIQQELCNRQNVTIIPHKAALIVS